MGELSRREQERHGKALRESGVHMGKTFTTGEQMGEQEPELFLVYPEGNCTSGAQEALCLQIGESTCRKADVRPCAVGRNSLTGVARRFSLDCAMRISMSVGSSPKLAVYARDDLQVFLWMSFQLAWPDYSTLPRSDRDVQGAAAAPCMLRSRSVTRPAFAQYGASGQF